MNDPTTAVVVNDDATQLAILCELVAKAGLKALPFTGAEEALCAMNPEAPPGLIVTDIYMPGLDGWRFCRLLRSPEYAFCAEVPILVVSATFAGDHPARIADDLGADAFLPSPVDGKQFVNQVHALLSGKTVRRLPPVLIVEDSLTLSGMLKKAFAAKGHRADVAHSIREATEAFAGTPYDVAVLDYHLPDGTGDVLLDAIQARRPDCACLMMTTDPTPELALSWMKRGASAYLRKPFEPEFLIELCARARRERALMRVEDLLEARTRELRAEHRRLEAILEGTRAGTWEWNVLTGETVFNERWAEILGYTLAELAPVSIKTWETLAHHEDFQRSGELLARHFAGDLPYYDCDCRMRHKDGRWVWVRDHGRVTSWMPDGTPQWMSGTHLEITARKMAEERNRLAREEWERTFDAVPDLICTLDAQHRILRANAAMAKALGVTLAEVEGLTCYQMVHGTQRPPDFCPHAQLLRDHQEHTVEVHEDRLGGDYQVTCTPLRDNEGQLIGSVHVARDISTAKREEEEREKLHAQLTQAQKMESVGRLAGGVAHDFNNMLGVILGHTELAAARVDAGSPLHADLAEIRHAAERSADLTRQLLAFARKQTIAPRVMDLNETVEGTLKMLRRLIGENLELVWRPDPRLSLVKLDPSQIAQVLANLCVNARDAIDGVGTITIETGEVAFDEAYCATHTGSTPGRYIRLTVSDDGCGMDAETQMHLFEPFFTTKGVGRGTGLGLATVYGIVKQNGGFVHVSSELGHGTTVSVDLPRYAGAGEPCQAGGAAEPTHHGHETILLVEDEPALLTLCARMLEQLGYRVLAAGTPGEALRVAEGHVGEIHVVLTDVVMPEMNGKDLAANLVSLYPGIKRLYMSGYTANAIAHHGVLDACVAFIQKPFSVKDLATKVRAVLGGDEA